jgi:cytochrome c oxidase cbb3-type subunit 3
MRGWAIGLSLAAIFMAALWSSRLAAADPAAGQKVSRVHCAKCHGDEGRGDGGGLQKLQVDVKPVPWTDKVAMARWKDEDLRQIITAGGKAVGKSKVMPPYRDKLSATELADVIAYIRSLAK